MARLAVAATLALSMIGAHPMDQDPTPTASESSTSALPGFVPGFGDSQPPVVTDEPEIADDERLVPPPPEWPIGGALGQRLWCIEGFESNHSGLAVNRSSGARGWLQWLPGTARAWGVVIGDRASEWTAAARIAAQGERFFRS
jgi:hypothetical protein